MSKMWCEEKEEDVRLKGVMEGVAGLVQEVGR